MATFLIGLVVLFVGAAIYGKFCEKVFGPDDRETPAYIIGVCAAVAYVAIIVCYGKKRAARLQKL